MVRSLTAKLRTDGAVAIGGRAVAASRRPPGFFVPLNDYALALSVINAGIAAWTFHRATSYGFSQDDFLGLARADGLSPRLAGFWRPLSHQWFWDALRMFGDSATLGHVALLVAHAGCAALLTWLLTRRFSPAAACIGGAFFASHPALYTGVWWLAANGDIGATCFALLSLAVFHRRGRMRLLAMPLFVLALACKESALPLPLALLALRVAGPAPRERLREVVSDRVWLGLCAIAGAAAVALFAASARSALGGESYALSGGALLPNLLTYDGWTANRWFATVRGFGDAVDPTVFAWGVGLNVTWLAGLGLPALRARGWGAAGLAFAAMLLPVLPLAHHAYHYYLYAAMPAAALLVTQLADALLAQVSTPRALAVAALAAMLFSWDGYRLVTRIETAPFVLEGLRADPTVDRARIAANALAGLEQARLSPGARIWLWSPESQALERERGGDPARESYFEGNVRAALLDGLAVRVMVPAVREARFVRTCDPDAARAVGARYALYRPDGTLRVFTDSEMRIALASAVTAPRH